MTAYIATDIVVPVPDLRSGDTILDGGDTFRLCRPAPCLHTTRLSRWDAYDATGDLVPLDLPVSESRRVVGREG